MSKVATFKGHGTMALFVNVALAVNPFILTLLMPYYLSSGAPSFILVWCAFFIIQFPHQTYLFFEIKHLINKDGIADDRDTSAVVVFGGLSLLGLVLQVATIVRLIILMNLTSFGLFAVIPFSIVAALGGCLGLTDLAWLAGFWPPVLIKHLKIVFTSRRLLAICLGTTVLLTVLTTLTL